MGIALLLCAAERDKNIYRLQYIYGKFAWNLNNFLKRNFHKLKLNIVFENVISELLFTTLINIHFSEVHISHQMQNCRDDFTKAIKHAIQ